MKSLKVWGILLPMLALSLVAPPAAADGPVWRGEYYDNQWLVGAPIFARDDPVVNFNWGAGSPGAAIPADHFSARWTRHEYFPGGDVHFYVTADDGVRLWVDDHLLIDQWHNQSATTYEGIIYLSSGAHFLRLEYYEDDGDAVVQCRWESGIERLDWEGEYFNNTHLGGTPVLQRSDPHISFDWGVHSPGPGVDSDHFSVRWTRAQYFDGGTYRFTATADDGIRVWVDGRLLIDEWWEHPVRSFSRDITLTPGDHLLQVEYYEEEGFAVARLFWEKVSVAPSAQGAWYGEYFDNILLGGVPTMTRYDSAVGFAWGRSSPDWRIPSDYFSARWTAVRHFDTGGVYTFSARSDDGVRVWVDGILVVDGWYDHPTQTFSGDRWLSAGDHSLRIEYYERMGMAEVEFWWDSAPPATEVVVDERGSGFVWGGALLGRYNLWAGYGGHAYFTYNNRYNWTNYAKWVPVLPHAGNYEVYVYIPGAYATTGWARYRILHNGIRSDRLINQRAYSNQWVSLGTYYFNAWDVGREFVLIYDNTGEWPYSRYIGMDAVKFVAR